MSSSSSMSEEQKAAIEELKAKLEAGDDEVVDENAMNRTYWATTYGIMQNNGVGTLKFLENKDWSGSVVGCYPPYQGGCHPPSNCYPPILQVRIPGKFKHKGVIGILPPKDLNGSMGAVVYVGPNQQGGPITCGWLLAWHVPGDNKSPNKVYVETRPSTKYVEKVINWETIKAKLEDSGNYSYYVDYETGAEAYAAIDAFGNPAHLVAIFDVKPPRT